MSENNHEVEIALLKQRLEMTEQNVRKLDDDIQKLSVKFDQRFDKQDEKLDSIIAKVNEAKSFGAGGWYVIGIVVSVIILFKDQIIAWFFSSKQ
jgi:hypothetical protein